MKPLFIVFEGIDGSGTSTQTNLLKDYFTTKGHKVAATYEPSNGPIGKFIRETLKTKHFFVNDERRFDEQMAYLFAADRYYHLYNKVDGVIKLLNDNFHVISTRYYFSSLAYHCSTAEDFEFVKKLNDKFPDPDLVVYIDIPLEVALKRLSDRPSREVYETREKLAQVSSNYQDIFQKYKGLVLTVDGTKDIDLIHQNIVKFIQENFKD